MLARYAATKTTPSQAISSSLVRAFSFWKRRERPSALQPEFTRPPIRAAWVIATQTKGGDEVQCCRRPLCRTPGGEELPSGGLFGLDPGFFRWVTWPLRKFLARMARRFELALCPFDEETEATAMYGFMAAA